MADVNIVMHHFLAGVNIVMHHFLVGVRVVMHRFFTGVHIAMHHFLGGVIIYWSTTSVQIYWSLAALRGFSHMMSVKNGGVWTPLSAQIRNTSKIYETKICFREEYWHLFWGHWTTPPSSCKITFCLNLPPPLVIKNNFLPYPSSPLVMKNHFYRIYTLKNINKKSRFNQSCFLIMTNQINYYL